jgi:hypothetical protein
MMMVKQLDGLPAITDNEVYVKFTVVEPLFVPPFLTGSDCEGHHPGFYGINSLNITANFAPSANRAWRCCRYPYSLQRCKPSLCMIKKPLSLM